MSYYEDVYKKRVNRYGNDYQSRLQGQREKVFEDLLLKSSYRVDFIYNGELQPGLLERYQQDDSKTIQYLLTRVDLNMPHGTLLDIPDKDLINQKWLVFYLESIKASGYNRYFVLKVSHTVSWYLNNNFQSNPITSYGYLYGPHRAAIVDTNKNKTEGSTPFFQNDNNYYIIMPTFTTLKKDAYIELTSTDSVGNTYNEGFKVDGIDKQSNPGIQYVTIDPTHIYDKTAKPVKPQGSTDPGYDWFNGNFGGNS